ncbi:MAG: methionine synthase [Planctomycetota bacterium]|jgi:5-methyltetrahydrofolate--homocysteine methyltransferase
MSALEQLLASRILCLDGAMGTAIQARDLTAEDFGGAECEGCNEHLNLTRPDVIASIHRGHLEAGADIIETNTFGSTSLVLAEYPPLHELARDITLAGARIARRAADEFADKPRFVAGSMGPTTKAISVTGGVTFEELAATFGDQARALVEGGVDYLLIETAQDTRNIKAALLGARRALRALGKTVPIAVSGTIEPMGTMLGGQTADALAVSLGHADLLYLGLNCATGPDFMTDHLRALAELAETRTACVPNAGLPDEDGHYLETPETIAHVLERFVDEGWLNLVGGCCGTTDRHVAALARMVEGKRPRAVPRHHRALFSGLEFVEAEPSNRPLLVGERTNSLGSRKFKRLIAEEQFEAAAEIARRQVRSGAQIIDICLQNPDRDERVDMRRFLDRVVRMVKAPLMIDSTDADVIAEALTYCQGKAIINSINLEEGRARFERVVPLAREYGAALIVGCIDEDPEQGMAVTRERKMAVARRAYAMLTEEFGVDPADIIFDPLVFPCGTGDVNYLGSARETVEGLRLIKEALPLTKTILGISNVSFGLPPAGREVLNSVFLYHCTKAGLDLAIVNTEKLERYASIPDEEKALAEAILFDTSDATVARFTAHFREARSRVVQDVSTLGLDERLAERIVTGTKEGLIEDLDAKLEETAPLDIINGPLMAGMDEVGRLFNRNELIVAEVLQSAEVMKAAVAHLEPFMEKDEGARRGTVLLATVKGDVHDIGKNLVDIILTNNGYRVINLGIKVPPHDLIEAIDRHAPDLIGLSGLLVKSAHQMVVTAEELSVHQRCPPILVGGAALTRSFTRKRIAPRYGGLTVYAKDAMDGLDLAHRILDPAARPALLDEIEQEERDLAARSARRPAAAPEPPAARRRPAPVAPPPPPDLNRHVMRRLPLDEVWHYVNPHMLYGKHLGLKGRFEELVAARDEKALQLRALIDELKEEARRGGMVARAVWQFFGAGRCGDAIRLHAATDRERTLFEFPFPRQERGDRLCLADYVAEGPDDHLCLFVVTAGEGIRARAERYRAAGAYLKSHAVQALALETAEAAAEWLHHKLRGRWGFPDPPGTTMRDRWRAQYRGKRYSFGYPACPDLALQEPLFALLEPGEIGVTLTEEHMMDPEASVSGLVLHHPEARYFSVRNEAT